MLLFACLVMAPTHTNTCKQVEYRCWSVLKSHGTTLHVKCRSVVPYTCIYVCARAFKSMKHSFFRLCVHCKKWTMKLKQTVCFINQLSMGASAAAASTMHHHPIFRQLSVTPAPWKRRIMHATRLLAPSVLKPMTCISHVYKPNMKP